VLEVGCGTGALLGELPSRTSAHLHGLDIDLPSLEYARENLPRVNLTGGDAHTLPYSSQSFDLVFCHFLLLWVARPEKVVREMVRITHPGGALLLTAEPDYGGRIDHPEELAVLGGWQQKALVRQGADPEMGRRLASLLAAANLEDVETGVLGGRWLEAPSPGERKLEWLVLESDLDGIVDPHELQRLHDLEEQAWENGERVLFVPTFYAWGRVPKNEL
jgi:SAM-dependent methyltransferase